MFNKKKSYFKRKLKHEDQKLWELEFKIIQSRKIREGVRQDRDRTVEGRNRIEVALKDEQLPEDKKTQYESDLKATNETISRYEKQIQMIDDQVNGFDGDENRESIIGLLEMSKSGVEHKKMVSDHIKTL